MPARYQNSVNLSARLATLQSRLEPNPSSTKEETEMSKKLRVFAVASVLVIGGIVAVSITSAVPPPPRRLYILQENQCTACPQSVREECQLTGCLPTVDGGGSLCQYDCFGG
jgi:hypothetical protein